MSQKIAMKRLSKNSSRLILFFIILLALFLRFYRIEQNFIFTGEVGHNLLAIKNAYMAKVIPLLGPPTSHPWLYFGPLFYWIYGPVLILSKFNPLSHAYFGALVSFLIVILNFLTVRRIFNERVALNSSLLIGVSPLLLEFSRFGRFFSIVGLLVYPFLYCLYEIFDKRRNLFLHLGLLFGAMFSFHFAPLMLAPFMVSAFVIKRFKPNRKSIFLLISGFFITMLPFFIYDIKHSLSMTKSVLIWIPYRIIGFLGLYPKNNLSVSVIHDNSESIYTFITRSFIVNGYPKMSFLIGILFLIFFLWLCKKIIDDRSKSYSLIFILLWFLWGCVAVFVHGSPPIHYFLPIHTAPIIIFTVGVDLILRNKQNKIFIFIFIFLISVINFGYYFSDKWYFISNESIVKNPYYVPYVTQREVVRGIIVDSKNQKLKLYRSGIYDNFEDNYGQNYHYLLWLYGNEPIKNSNLTYTIYENPTSDSKDSQSEIIIKLKDIKVTKAIKKIIWCLQ